jgi:transposase
VEQFEGIRRDRRLEGLSIRALARRHKVHRRTVREALASAIPAPRRVPERGRSSFGAYEATVRQWLEDDKKAPRKQRHTARRVWQRLVREEGARVPESTVRENVRRIRAEIADPPEAMVPQLHQPGQEAEVDFGELWAYVAGVLTKLWLFSLRLSASGRAIHKVFATQAQEAFLAGHVYAFERLGGVPAGRIRYDNLKPAVARVLLGRDRIESERFVAFRSHYLLTELHHLNTQVRGHVRDPPWLVDVLLDNRPHDLRGARAITRPGRRGGAPGRPAGGHRGPMGALSAPRPGRGGCGGGVGVVR